MEDTFRPDTLDSYIGQESVRRNLEVLIHASKVKGSPVDHVLLFGPAGTGKTTVARIVAHETGASLHETNGNSLGTVADMISVLRNIKFGDVLFIDEAHGMKKSAAELLYTAMEGSYVDVIAGEGVKIPLRIALPRFTVVLATTRPDLISKPLTDRCGSQFRLKLYTLDELSRILIQANWTYKISADADGIAEIAKRSRGTPRVALRLLRRVSDYALAQNAIVTACVADEALTYIGVDKIGLTELDIEYLTTLIKRFNGGPAGLISIAGAMPNGATDDEIAGAVEPWLKAIGLIDQTSRGRVATKQSYLHLGFEPPADKFELMGRD